MLGKRFTGAVCVDGTFFTHPDVLLGTADNKRNVVLKNLRKNLSETMTNDWLAKHDVELHIVDRATRKVEHVKF